MASEVVGVAVAHAIELFFDERPEAAVRDVWNLLADAGLPSLATPSHRRHRPHVSLTVVDGLDAAGLAALESVVTNVEMTLRLDALGLFPGETGTLFLGVVVSADLLALHAAVHSALPADRMLHQAHYLPGRWVPHCTLAQGLSPDESARAVALLCDVRPIVARVAEVGATDTITGEVTPLTSGRRFTVGAAYGKRV